MNNEVLVEINGEKYSGLISSDRKFISIYNVVSVDDLDFLGKFILDGNNLIEIFPMSQRIVVVGKII